MTSIDKSIIYLHLSFVQAEQKSVLQNCLMCNSLMGDSSGKRGCIYICVMYINIYMHTCKYLDFKTTLSSIT